MNSSVKQSTFGLQHFYPVIYALAILFITIKLINNLFPSEPVKVSTHKRESIKYDSLLNDRSIGKPFIVYAHELLGLEGGGPLTVDIINDAYYKQLHFVEEDQLMGYEIKVSTEDLEAARGFLIEWANYMGYRN